MPVITAGFADPDENGKKLVPRANGCVASFIDEKRKIGAMVELSRESEFTASSDKVRHLAEQIAQHMVERNSKLIRKEDSATGLSHEQSDVGDKETYLLEQRLSGEPGCTIREVMARLSSELEDDIRLRRFVRLDAGGKDVSFAGSRH